MENRTGRRRALTAVSVLLASVLALAGCRKEEPPKVVPMAVLASEPLRTLMEEEAAQYNSLYPGAKGLAVTFSQALDAEYRAKGLKVTAVCPGFTKTDFGAAAGVQAIMDEAPRIFWQSAETVVETAIAANERGKVVVIPGWHNRLSVFLMRARISSSISILSLSPRMTMQERLWFS